MKLAFLITLIVLFLQASPCQEVRYDKVPEDLQQYIYADTSDIKWFTDAKFGVFVHWGPYSIAGVPASWGRFGPRPGAGRQATGGIPLEEYDRLYENFNPVNFNADQWIKMVSDSGARYFIFTTKHHDGFCMFDAENTDYKITNTPFGRDVAKEIADACHENGVKLFWYYSQPDWHHPDCLTENNDRYRDYMYQHLEQLLTEYGEISGIFFDGLGTKYYDWDTPRILRMIRTLQPGIIVNRRWGAGIPGYPVSGDYDTHEQEFGIFENERPWEMNCTITEAWSWTGGENYKTYRTNQRMLIQTSCSGGNFALNTGPSPTGVINPPEREIFEEIGIWLSRYGESIYETRGGPYKPGPWGGSTFKDNTVFLHLLTDFTDESGRVIELPALPANITEYSLLTGGEVEVINLNDNLNIRLSGDINQLDNIIILHVDRDAAGIDPLETIIPGAEIDGISGSASSFQNDTRTAGSVFGEGNLEFAEGKKHKIWWSPARSDREPWIKAEFQDKEEIDYIMLAEQIRNCSTREFVIEYSIAGKWEELYRGEEIGMDFRLKTHEVKTKAIRIRILSTKDDRIPAIGICRVFRKS